MIHQMKGEETQAERYEAAGLKLPSEAARVLAVWQTVKEAAYVPEVLSISSIADQLTADNVLDKMRQAALSKTLKDYVFDIMGEVERPLAKTAHNAFEADTGRRHDQLTPRFLAAADVIVEAAGQITPDQYLDPTDLLTLNVNSDDAPDRYRAITATADLYHRAVAATEQLEMYAPLLTRYRNSPASFITTPNNLTTWQTATEAFQGPARWLALYSLDGIAPAVNSPADTDALLAHVEHLTTEADRLAAERLADHPTSRDHRGTRAYAQSLSGYQTATR